MPAPKTTLVIGATSSIAQALCRELARRGDSLILTGREESELSLLASDLQARHHAACRYLLCDMLAAHYSPTRLLEQAGEFNRIVIAVGDMQGDLERLARLNYILPAQLAQVAAEKLAEKGQGTVAVISSVAGDRGRQSNYAYGSAKAGLNAYLSGLRNRFCRSGVRVITLKPGFVDTPMTWGMKSPLIASREYVARGIAEAMEKNRDVVYVPWFWRWIMLVIIHLPERLFKRLSL